MMIPIAILWMWMAQQSEKVTVACDNGVTMMIPIGQVVPSNKIAGDAKCPADHLIEIRTKRAHREVKNWHECGDGDTLGSNTSTTTPYTCWSVETRELWIDGQRWGTIKYSEEP